MSSDHISGQFQYIQYCQGQTGLVVGIRDVLLNQRTPYQHLQVMETDILGRMMLLDGIIMLTEHDEFAYHEMLVHPAMQTVNTVRRVLIAGGGDGGTAREVLRYAEVEQVDMVEIDEAVVQASKQFFPTLSAGLADPRFNLFVQDGLAFVNQAAPATYDLILVDGTDPLGFGENLYQTAFYAACAQLLTDQGIMVMLSESPFDPAYRHVVGRVHRDLRAHFPVVATYLTAVPTYQMGLWSFALGSKQLHPVHHFDSARAAQRLAQLAAPLRYYNPGVHLGAFALPNFVQDLVDSG